MLISLTVFGFIVYLAARAPIKGFEDKQARMEAPEPRQHSLTLPAVGLGSTGAGGKTVVEEVSVRPQPQPQPQPVRWRLRRRAD